MRGAYPGVSSGGGRDRREMRRCTARRRSVKKCMGNVLGYVLDGLVKIPTGLWSLQPYGYFSE